MLVWADGFDHYGNVASMGHNAYAAAFNNGASLLSTDPDVARTGNGSVLIVTPDNELASIRLDFDNSGLVFGVGFGLMIQGGNPPASANSRVGFSLLNGGVPFFTIYPNSDRGLTLTMGDVFGAELARTEPNVIFQLYNWIEFKAFSDPLLGYVEVRVNDRRVMLATELAFPAAPFSGFRTLKGNGVSSGWGTVKVRLDDLVVWDDTGTVNNDFFGQATRCRTRFAASDGPAQDWGVTGPDPAWQAIGTVPPDPDASNITAANVGDISNFGAAMLPTTIAYGRGTFVAMALHKSLANATGFTPQYVLDGVTYSGTEINPAFDDWNWYQQLFEKDPLTDAYWTLEHLQAFLPQVERTA